MNWFCNTKEAKKHKETCKKNPNECGKCIWIDMSSHAMGKYGKTIEQKSNEIQHPLTPEILRVFKSRRK
mgnify:CR=1 FL=1|tara:strand:- start:991 stop:1197 length:207 start_codon:yes stop_codon:yes gene_type:complete